METISALWEELSHYSITEIIAVAASLSYVVLAAKENRYCWPAALVGSALYAVIFWQHKLLMDSALNIYYVAMAIYGWSIWSGGKARNKVSNKTPTRTISTWKISTHCFSLAAIATLSLASGYWLDRYSEADFPYLDSLTTWSSLLATWMVARKILENWIYWIAIDALSIYLYLNKALLFTSALFLLYVVIAVFGFLHWRRVYQQQNAQQQNIGPTAA